ncbi:MULTISPECIES: ABC transporter permease [Micromonospora]|uniref:ABC transporter permease n=1 Tax=Micromonospora solifontis TaxID=2487138 RepID=A0ABX9WI80_9ACTN|nr:MULTISPECIES: ABC transporter permease [Micromonospora]NES16349.1 ABC transporter permease [Micromonospora sp. PPF5-17B]NES36199.1 ABC transporter permease [Micromonospora solifontis]NES57950.1 ABC transporter permease [Micromonospora sp. PPF5-6]RNL99789.1 ABC transporter permease [Micromonospora solifontis]
MAVPVTTPDRPARRVGARHFVRLKLRVMGNNFRGQGWRIALFVVGVLFGLWVAAGAFFALAAPGLAGEPRFALLTAAFGGGLLVLGWLLLPLVFFGVDETLDPARFALLPLPRRTLVTGLFAAALVSVPLLATLVAVAGLVVTAGALGGWAAALVSVLGIVGGLLLCVAAARAVTSAFATMLRSRRVRDLAAVLLAVLAALLGPLQIAVLAAVRHADWDRLTGAARVIGWTPLGAPWTAGVEVAEGRPWAALVKLLITVAALGALLFWWSRTLESAMVGTATAGPSRQRRGPAGGPVAQLFPRAVGWARRDRFGALVARECRYWWRDARRRANLITIAVVGVFVPVMVNLGGSRLVEDGGQAFDGTVPYSSPVRLSLSMLFVGVVASVTLANQFGFDGSAYAANVVAGVPGRLELRARMTAFAVYVVPILVAVAIILATLLGRPAWLGVMAGTLFAAYGVGLAINAFVAVLGGYALPETSNPFAMNSGAGAAKGLLTLLSMVASALVAVPMVLAAALLGGAWLWLALPVGLAYGVGAALLGAYLAGDVLDRRQPELLSAVTPRR